MSLFAVCTCGHFHACRRAPVALFDEIVLEIKSLIFSNHYHSFLKNGKSFAAQRALEWAAEYQDMGMQLQKSIVIQLFEEYHQKKKAAGEFSCAGALFLEAGCSAGGDCVVLDVECAWCTEMRI